jgi:hypothetical protein
MFRDILRSLIFLQYIINYINTNWIDQYGIENKHRELLNNLKLFLLYDYHDTVFVLVMFSHLVWWNSMVASLEQLQWGLQIEASKNHLQAKCKK